MNGRKDSAPPHPLPVTEETEDARLAVHGGNPVRRTPWPTQSDKSLNCGEGGFLLTDDSMLFARAVVLSGIPPWLGGADAAAREWMLAFSASCTEIQGAIDRGEFGWGIFVARKRGSATP